MHSKEDFTLKTNKTARVTSALRLYLVTDRRYHPEWSLEEQVRAAIEGGVTSVQLREKNLPESECIALGKSIHAITRASGIPLIINDSPAIAKAAGAEGVHLGQEDGNICHARALLGDDAIIGVTAKSIEQAVEAEKNGADYLGVGALFTSKSKSTALQISFDTFDSIVSAVKIPVVAIGGISAENVSALQGHRMAGVAVIAAILDHDSIREGTRHFNSLLSEVMRK
jgi:thiamine-phosphate pyrophosphorylase